MRQAGVLAAAGLVALTEMIERLADDHANARRLADIKGISIAPGLVRTNIVFFEITRSGLAPEQLAERLNHQGVRLSPTGPNQMRAVTNYHVTPDDIEYVLIAFSKALKPLQERRLPQLNPRQG